MKYRSRMLALASGLLILASLAGCGTTPAQPDDTSGIRTGPSAESSLSSQPGETEASGAAPGSGASDAVSGSSTSGAAGSRDDGQRTTTTARNQQPTAGASGDDEEKIPGLEGIRPDSKIDFKGETVRVGYWAQHMTGAGTDEASMRARQLNQKIEQTYNCKLEFINVENGKLAECKTSIMSGSPMVDMFAIQGADTFNSYYRSNCLQPLDSFQYIDMNDEEVFYIPALASFNNHQYGLTTRIFSWYQKAFGTALLVNFDLTSRAGYTADKLYQMQDSGQWNWENFEKVMTETLRQLNDSSIIGLTDLSSPTANDWYNFEQSFEFYTGLLYANNTDWVSKNGDKFTFTGGSGQALKVLEQYTKWANPNTGFIKYTDDNWTRFKNGKSVMLATMYATPFAYRDQVVGEASVGMMYFPKGPDATDYISRQMNQTFVVIPTGVKNKQMIGAVFQAINQPLYKESESRGLNRMDAAKASSIQQSVDTMDAMFRSEYTWSAGASIYGVAAGLGYNKDMTKAGWYDYVYRVAIGEMQISEALNAFSAKADSVLNSYYG